MASFIITARVGDDGVMVHGQKTEVRAWLKAHAGEVVTLTFEKKRKPRSHDQLQWLFGIAYPALAKEAGYDDHESDYMQWVSRFAATEYHLDIPLPDEWREQGAR